jgi:long-chain acyl-CoA synthetase
MTDPFDWQALYPEGVSRAIHVPDAPLWHALGASARQGPDKIAIHHGDRSITYRELWRAAQDVAERLGPGDGERIVIQLPNRPEFVAWYHGALRAGRIVVAASPHLTATELDALIDDAEPTTVRTASGTFHRDVDEEPRPAGRTVAGAVAVLQYTSGTTGGLKAAQMTHGNLLVNALQNNAWFGWKERDVVLGALPLCHTWGMGCVMNASLLAGATIALVEQFDPEETLDVVARRGVTIVYGSATMFHRLLDAAGPRAADVFRGVRYVKAGAMLVGGDLPQRWSDAVPNVPMINGYGLTEASPEVTNNPPHAPRRGTVGVPLPGTHVRLCRPDDPTREVARGDEGEVQVRGPQVMRGYWRRPAETAAAFVENGETVSDSVSPRWLRTGDVGRFDDAGYLVIVDRLKDLIKFRGYSVAPAEIERALVEHPAVAEACVVGAPHPVDGETPVAFVRLRAGATTTDAELTSHLEPRLARFKQPREFRFVDEIPKNAVGKPLRRVLRDRARG